MGVGVGGVQAVDVAQQHQKVGADAAGDDGGQRVVVADGGDLIGGDGVVFVDDRQGTQLQQAGEGILDVLPAAGVLDVHAGQQNLRHGVVVGRKEPVVGVHQFTLPHGGASLLGGHILRPRRERKLAHAHADGTRGDQNDFVPGVFQVTEDFDQFFGVADVQPPGGVCQRRGADFDDDAHTLTLSHFLGFCVSSENGVHHRAPEAVLLEDAHALNGASGGAAHGVFQRTGMLAALKH